MEKKKYRLYLDESGDHSKINLESKTRRYLGLTGIVSPFSLENLQMYEMLENLKKKYFSNIHPDDAVLLHREDIREGNGVFRKLKENEEMHLAFDQDLINILTQLNYMIITVVIDKKRQIERYKERAFDPYEFGFIAMLERYCGWLDFKGAQGDIVAERRGVKEDISLQEKYIAYYEKGTGFPALEKIQCSFCCDKVNFKVKEANVAGLQLADLIANPSKQQILIEKKIIDDTRSDFSRKLSEIFDRKYNRRYKDGEMWAYGKIFKDFTHL